MAQYMAFEPEVEVSGAVLLSLITGTQERIVPILVQHGITGVQAGGWYPKQAMLDALREFGQMADLVSIGMRIPDLAQWPPEIQTIWDAFEALDTAYHMNHRGGRIGHYRVEKTGEQALTVVVENPYPCDFDYGLMYGLARRYLSPGVNLRVGHDDSAPCRKKGAESCRYVVTW
jgi:hypothetical protein